MAIYFVTGKLGSGKTLCAVGKIRDYLQEGRRVVTNLDLDLNNLLRSDADADVIRIPDKPRVEDFQIIGRGCEEENEDKYGAIVLDELGTWFNSRSWRDKERGDVIDWFLHARKLHWDIFFIVQDISVVDKQLRSTLCEHLVICKRTDRLTIPFIGALFRFIGFDKILPKVHIASVYYGDTPSDLRVARWTYRGKDLYDAYNTRQIFRDDNELKDGEVIDMRSSYSFLSPYVLNSIKYKNQLMDKLQNLNSNSINQTDKNTSARSSSYFSRFDKSDYQLLFGALFLILIGYTFIDDAESEPSVDRAVSLVQPGELLSIKTPTLISDEPLEIIPQDFLLKLFHKANVSIGLWRQEGLIFDALILIQRDKQPDESLTLDDVRALGWIPLKRADFVILSKEGQKSITIKIG